MICITTQDDLDTGGSVAKYIPTLIPINSLSGGVGRQAPSKRMPNEASTLDNVYCTLERSVERRRGSELVTGANGLPTRISLASTNIWYDWFIISEDHKFLICIDREATVKSDLLRIFRLDANDNFELVDVDYQSIPTECLNYLTHGTADLKRVAVGTSLLLLNPEVYAGFTSDTEDDFTFDLSGTKTEETDLVGREANYQSAARVDPESEAVIWTQYSAYVAGDKAIDGTHEVQGFPPGTYEIWKVKDDVSGTITSHAESPRNDTGGAGSTNRWELVQDPETNEVRRTKRLPVKEYIYPDPDKPELGQSVLDLSKIKLPPPERDLNDFNGAEAIIKTLYPGVGDVTGNGKVYYFAQKYGTTTPGYYRVKDSEKSPYLHKVRTPDKLSVIDKKRMPMQLAYDSKEETWSLRMVDWDPRESGTKDTNPGPSPFMTDDGTARQAQISSISFYRDRLFLSSGDKLFSSRMGNWDNFWIDDPTTIVATDPIDLSVSSNKYSPITHTIPFNDFLFINTKGDTQFELIGSENQITPFTAEIAPTTFYSTLPEIEPQLMSSQIYFFGQNRLYIYFNSEASNINQAVPVSNHVPGYLPDSVKEVATSPAHDTIFFTDENERNVLYMYTNRFAGDQVVQNAFFRQVFNPEFNIEKIGIMGDNIYMVAREEEYAYLYKLPLRIESDLTDYTPRLDANFYTTNMEYDNETNITTITVPYLTSTADRVVVMSTLNKRWVYECQAEPIDTDNVTKLHIAGRVQGNEFVVGKEYTSVIELSEQFVRDQNNNTQDGVLNLRSINLRHNKSGQYDVVVSRRNRTEEITSFGLLNVDSLNTLLDMDEVSDDGELKARVFGLSNEVTIIIRSSYPEPFNITNIELRGKFSKRDSILEKR